MTTAYRKDIDGLRALAVLPVLLYHTGVPGFGGGYVGVDVFFVISGFLITQILIREMDNGTLSYERFLERRVRRIFPALFVMLIVCFGISALFMIPDDFKEVGRTTVGALFSVNNFIFYGQAGYFDEHAIVKPLLHTWSLGVEEQFYLFFPLFLMVIAPFTHQQRLRIVGGAAVLSLAACIVGTQLRQEFAFYMLPTRAWELLAGSLLAMGVLPAIAPGAPRRALSLLGLVLISAPVLIYDSETPFPGFAALAPVGGAVLLLHCAPHTPVGRMLSLPPFRGIGLVSYSLYLWHWPIIVLMSYYWQAELSAAQSAFAILLSFVAATLSWAFVERPFRQQLRIRSRTIWRLAFGSVTGLGGIAALVLALDGAPQRFSIDLAPYQEARNISPLRRKCHTRDNIRIAPADACKLGAQNKAPRLLVWGDSHGVELAYALGEVGSAKHFSLLQMTASVCPPVLDSSIVGVPDCPHYNRAVLAYLSAHPEIETVIFSAFFEFPRYREDSGFGPGLIEAIQAVRNAGRQAIVVGPVPEQPFEVPRQLALAAVLGTFTPQGVATTEFSDRTRPLTTLMDEARRAGASVVLPQALFCAGERCTIMRDGRMLYFDEHHLSLDGARIVAAEVERLLVSANSANRVDIGGPPPL
jgi:peptidoglycan/LPS O-acetylase OafA/YrhL